MNSDADQGAHVSGGTGATALRYRAMVHPLLASSEFRGPALEALAATFVRVCHELQLTPRADPITDIVAETVLRCVREGKTDPAHVLKCTQAALKNGRS